MAVKAVCLRLLGPLLGVPEMVAGTRADSVFYGSRPFWLALLFVVGLLAASLTPVPAAQAADTVITVNFETGPALGTPVNDDYLSSSFVRFVESDPGFRPYRRSAPGKARSGSVAADVGYDVCYPETHDGSQCEFVSPSMTARLSRSASSVTVYAGLFSTPSGSVAARLTAHLSNGSQIVGTAVPISAAGFTTPVTVSSPVGNITSFVLSVVGGINSSLGFDDLTMTFPAGSLPDIDVSVQKSVATVLQAGYKDILITITRINGSDGPIDMKVSGLPAGVSGYFLTDPVMGSGQSTTLRLTAADTAATFVQPVDVTVTGDPLGNAGVAPEPDSETFPIIVAANFELSVVGGDTNVDVPDCAASDVVLQVQRHADFTGTVTLAKASGSSTVTAEFLPSATVPPGTGLIEQRTLRLHKSERLQYGEVLWVLASAPGVPSRTLRLGLGNAPMAATLASQVGWAPRRGQPGSQIGLDGSGFCPGTRVQVGSQLAEVDTDVAPDRRSLTFRIPRPATSGPVRVLAPDGWQSVSSNELTVRTFRNREGLAFRNYPYEWLSFGELTDLVGIRDMFIEVNPCWPWYNCSIPTGVPDPLSYITWGVLNGFLRSSGGHCFGINRTVQELLGGKVPYSRFAAGVDAPWDLPAPEGPSAAMNTWLDGRHAGQGTAEYLWHYLGRDRSLDAQLSRARTELAAGRYPGIALRRGVLHGHVVTAYDVEDQPDGSVKVYVYDSNRPFQVSENGNGQQHFGREMLGGVITVAPGRGSWSFPFDDTTTWTGDGSDWYTVALSAIPDDPSLPSVNALMTAVIFGSPDSSAAVTDIPPEADYLPATDSVAASGAAGFVVRKGSQPLAHTVRGSARGSYSDSVVGDGFVGSVQDVVTGPGVTDRVTGATRAGWLSFEGGRDRALNFDLAREKGSMHRSASLDTHTSKGGIDRVGLGNALTYRHQGDPTAFSFELTSADRHGITHFVSPPVKVSDGDLVRAVPASWKSLDKVTLIVRDTHGERSTRLLRNHAKPQLRLHVGNVQLVKTGNAAKASVRFQITRKSAQATAGVVLRVFRKGALVAHRATGLNDPARGRSVTWRLGSLPRGRYRLVADVKLVAGGETSFTLKDRSQVTRTVR